MPGAVAVLVGLTVMLGGCGEQSSVGDPGSVSVETTYASPQSAEITPRPTETPVASLSSVPVGPSLQLMEEAQFWDVIGRSLKFSDGSIERQATELENILAGLPPGQVASFNARFVSKNLELYSWELWGAAYVLNDGCSDDCFEYFRSWVVSQGRDYFQAVQRDPLVLNDGRLSFASESDDAEWLSYVGEDAYRRASHGRDLYTDYPQSPSTIADGEPTGKEWDEKEVHRLHPDLEPLP